jgi:hypothetical protein
LLLLSLLVWL